MIDAIYHARQLALFCQLHYSKNASGVLNCKCPMLGRQPSGFPVCKCNELWNIPKFWRFDDAKSVKS